MDILSQYKQQNPEAFREKPKWQPSSEYGFLIRLVMRLSGGRIRDAKKASMALLSIAMVVLIMSIAIFIYSFSGSGALANPAQNIDQRQFSTPQR